MSKSEVRDYYSKPEDDQSRATIKHLELSGLQVRLRAITLERVFEICPSRSVTVKGRRIRSPMCPFEFCQ
jgi:hypothetical protein